MNQRSSNSVDRFVGARIKLRREEIGFSQEKLAHELDISFQQVQKYERGCNRVSASRLLQIAYALGVNVQFFFDGVNNLVSKDQASNIAITQQLATKGAFIMLDKYAKLPSDALRRKVIEMVTILAPETEMAGAA